MTNTEPPRLDAAALDELCALAEAAARAGGAVARAAFKSDLAARRKADGSEVTDADEAAQAATLVAIWSQRPQDAIIAEEDIVAGGGSPPAPRRSDRICWIIDPIDGTRSFLRGVPLYACSVAAMQGGFPVAGAIYWPDCDEMYSARCGGGLRVNGRPARRWTHERVGGAISRKPVAGIPSTSRGPAFDLIHSWVDRVVVRNLGSTALHLALVAEGRMDAALISDSKLWDIAAGWVLLDEAGGAMRRLDGRAVFPIDVGTYAGEAIPSLAARDEALLETLQFGGHTSEEATGGDAR